MNLTKKRRLTPLFKKFYKLRGNIQNRKKILNFKKNKWKNFINFYNKSLKNYQKFKPSDHSKFFITRYGTKGTGYKKKFRDKLNAGKSIRLFYGNLGKTLFKNKVKYAINQKTKTDSKITLLKLFETRLDTILYRSKFSSSIQEAGQLILHGKIYVNKKQIKNKSYVLKSGDIINIDKKYFNLDKVVTLLRNSTTWPIPPKYLLINYKTMQIIVLHDIKLTDFFSLYLIHLNLQKIIISFTKQL